MSKKHLVAILFMLLSAAVAGAAGNPFGPIGGGGGTLDENLTALAAIAGQRGDLIYYGAAGWTRLGKGTENFYLKQGANDPAWAEVAASSGNVATDTIWDAAGDVVIGTGANTGARLAKGAEGTVLTAGAATVSWAAPAVPASVTVADTTDATSYVALFESATGGLGPKTNAGITYNASTGALTITGTMAAASFQAAKISGVAGDQGFYEANSTDLDAAGFRGPAAMDANTSYRLELPTAKPTSANMFPVWPTAVSSGDGSPGSPFSVVGTWLDADNYALLSGGTFSGAWDFGGATSVEIPNSDDPDVDATGEISFDTDGWVRIYDGTRQAAVARVQEEIHVTVVKPQDMADAVRDAFLVWSNESGMSFVVTGWKGWSGADDTTLNIEETDADGANNVTVDAVELATGSGPYTGADTTITAATIENGHLLWLDFDDTDDPSYVKMVIYGYYNADVN